MPLEKLEKNWFRYTDYDGGNHPWLVPAELYGEGPYKNCMAELIKNTDSIAFFGKTCNAIHFYNNLPGLGDFLRDLDSSKN